MTGFKMIRARSRRSVGFTLIELLIVVTIIGIIVAFGYPFYTNKVIETRRSDAKSALARLATMQEKFFTECNQYALVLTTTAVPTSCGGLNIAWGAAVPALSQDGHYVMSIINPPPLGPAGNCTAATCFLLEADPSLAGASGLQQRSGVFDGNLRIDHAGRTSWDKGDTGATDAVTGMFAKGWNDK